MQKYPNNTDNKIFQIVGQKLSKVGSKETRKHEKIKELFFECLFLEIYNKYRSQKGSEVMSFSKYQKRLKIFPKKSTGRF